MRPSTKKGGLFLLPLFGAFLGYLVLHPYTMVVYGLYGPHGATCEGMDFRRLLDEVPAACRLDMLRQLFVTLAHNLLNAVQGIGGFASLAIRKEKDEDKRRPLEIIKREAIRIEATVKALQSLESVSTARYTKSSETLMIDIRKELQERIEALNKEQIEPPR